MKKMTLLFMASLLLSNIAFAKITHVSCLTKNPISSARSGSGYWPGNLPTPNYDTKDYSMSSDKSLPNDVVRFSTVTLDEESLRTQLQSKSITVFGCKTDLYK